MQTLAPLQIRRSVIKLDGNIGTGTGTGPALRTDSITPAACTGVISIEDSTIDAVSESNAAFGTGTPGAPQRTSG